MGVWWGRITSRISRDRWEEPYRTARIYDLLHDRHDLRPEDMLKAKPDTYSYPTLPRGSTIGSRENSEAQRRPRSKTRRRPKGLERNRRRQLSGSFFSARSAPVGHSTSLEPFLEKTRIFINGGAHTFLQKVLTDRPAKWLPAAYKILHECSPQLPTLP